LFFPYTGKSMKLKPSEQCQPPSPAAQFEVSVSTKYNTTSIVTDVHPSSVVPAFHTGEVRNDRKNGTQETVLSQMLDLSFFFSNMPEMPDGRSMTSIRHHLIPKIDCCRVRPMLSSSISVQVLQLNGGMVD
jgi:hypothetical protein